MRFEAPTSLNAAIELLENEAGVVRILAGGTDVLVQLRSGQVEPDLIVDIKRIEAMQTITEEDGGFRIGAAVCGAELGGHAGVCKLWPGVVEAVELIGSTQVQGRATMVGNLCNASPAADSVPAMVAAGATARVTGPEGSRDIPVEKIATGPGQTSLGRAELVESVYLPARGVHSSDAYLRFIPRTEMDIAVVGAGISIEMDGNGICTHARVALGAVGPRVMLVEDAATALIGTSIDEAALEALAQAASSAATPIDDKRGTVDFRIKVAGVLARRAAIIAVQRSRVD